jgi:hypothetical protein
MTSGIANGIAHELEVRFRNDMESGSAGYASGRAMMFNINFLLHVPQVVRGLFIHELTPTATPRDFSAGWKLNRALKEDRYGEKPGPSSPAKPPTSG